MCDMHRNRLRRHGHIGQTRPDDWGSKTGDGRRDRHPLYNSWAWLRRHTGKHPVCAEWADDFLQFVADVGGRPSLKHKLFSADGSRPIGPDNFVWKEAITQKVEGEDERTHRARIQRVYRAVRQEAFQGYDLKRHYGLSKEQYEELLSTQGHCCAICGLPEGATIAGRKLRLSVDHCHDSGKVRGLLCSNCNNGLGRFKDSMGALQAAIRYLEASRT